MAFVGIFIVAIAFLGLFYFGLWLIVKGTVFIRTTQRTMLGVILQVSGYLVAVPSFMLSILMGAPIVFIPAVIGVVVAVITCKRLGKPKT